MAKGKSEEDQPTSDAAGEEEDDEEEEEGDEYSAEHKAAMKAYKEEVQALHAEMEQAGRSLVRVGGVSDEVKSKDDIHKQIQFLSVADTQTSFIERFMSQVGRIGADVEDEDQLDELVEAIEDENAPAPAGAGLRMLSTRHSYMYAAVFEHALKQVQKAARKADWANVWQRLVALLLALYNYDQWLADTEEPAENNKILKRIGTQFEKLLATKDEGTWPAMERDFDACKGALQILNHHFSGFETGDEVPYKVPVKGAEMQN